MKIAQIAPLYESVPPKLYGGTERVVSYLTEELVNQGHEVTLFASADSVTKAKLVGTVANALRLDSKVIDTIAYHIVQIQEVLEQAYRFDVLHFHTDYFHFPFSESCKRPVLTTLHGRLDLQDLKPVYRKFSRQKVVSISDAQRLPLQEANWIDTIYHGIPENLYQKGEGKGDYVVFIGRIAQEKRPDRAIEIARRAGMKIKIAAKIDKADLAYYESSIRNLMAQPHVEFIGEIGEENKSSLLGNAKALLFPIDWPEPFGMVMIEAMACGTPVIAYRNGSVPEVLEHGETGFIVDSMDEAVAALQNIDMIDRDRVRKNFEQRFTAKIMTENYVKLYETLLLQPKRRNLTLNRSRMNQFETQKIAFS